MLMVFTAIELYFAFKFVALNNFTSSCVYMYFLVYLLWLAESNNRFGLLCANLLDNIFLNRESALKCEICEHLWGSPHSSFSSVVRLLLSALPKPLLAASINNHHLHFSQYIVLFAKERLQHVPVIKRKTLVFLDHYQQSVLGLVSEPIGLLHLMENVVPLNVSTRKSNGTDSLRPSL